jgi:hypothetical protein
MPPDYDRQNNAKTPDQIMSDAEQGFNLSHVFVPQDADYLRLGAAAVFREGVSKLLHEKLTVLGVTDDQIEQLAERGLLEEALQGFAPDEMDEIKQRVRRITASDPHAQNALENELYFTDRELG